MHFGFPEDELICFLAKKESRKLPSRRALADKQRKDEQTHSLVVGKFQPGLILHGALAQVNSCGARKGTQPGSVLTERQPQITYSQRWRPRRSV